MLICQDLKAKGWRNVNKSGERKLLGNVKFYIDILGLEKHGPKGSKRRK